MPCFVVSFCSLVCCLFLHGKKKSRTKTLAKKAARGNVYLCFGAFTAQRMSRQALSSLFYQIALICSSQVILRVEFTLLTRTAKDPLMYIATCALMVEDGPCSREDKMAR